MGLDGWWGEKKNRREWEGERIGGVERRDRNVGRLGSGERRGNLGKIMI